MPSLIFLKIYHTHSQCLIIYLPFIITGSLLLAALVPLGILEAIRMISNFHFAIKEGKCGFLTFITGSYLAPQNCKVIFDWKSSQTTVSNVSTFTIKVSANMLWSFRNSDRILIS